MPKARVTWTPHPVSSSKTGRVTRASVSTRCEPGDGAVERPSATGIRKPVTNQGVTTAAGDGGHSATHSDSGIGLACGNPTRYDAITV